MPKTTAPVTKNELADIVQSHTGCSGVTAKKVVDELFAELVKSVKKTGKASLFGFGTFKLTKRGARTGRNPKTGEPLKIKASKSVAFRPSKSVKDAL